MRLGLLVVAAVLVLSGCGTDTITTGSTASAGKWDKIVVAALRMPASARSAAEAEMAAAVSERGGQAVTMSAVAPDYRAENAQSLVRKVLSTGAEAVLVLDPFVFRENGKTVVRAAVLTGMKSATTQEVIDAPPLTYKAALYDVESIQRLWIGDVNSDKQRGRSYDELAGRAGRAAVEAAAEAGQL